MDYNWRDDVIDIVDNYDIPNDTKDDLFYRAAERIVEENGPDCYNDPEDAVYEEMANIITLDAIPFDSTLYGLLRDWYDSRGQVLEEEVRNYFDDGVNMYFVGGMNYDVFDADLLGGNGNGETKAAFEEFVRNA